MGKVPEYNLRAINKYNNKFDRIAVNLPKGSKKRIEELTGKSYNAFAVKLITDELDRLEALSKKQESSSDDQKDTKQDMPDWMN